MHYDLCCFQHLRLYSDAPSGSTCGCLNDHLKCRVTYTDSYTYQKSPRLVLI